MEGDPLNVSVCYLPFLPEAANLDVVTLVEDASRNKTTMFLQADYSAHFSVQDPRPGSYYFQVSTGLGISSSASFNVTIGMYIECLQYYFKAP